MKNYLFIAFDIVEIKKAKQGAEILNRNGYNCDIILFCPSNLDLSEFKNQFIVYSDWAIASKAFKRTLPWTYLKLKYLSLKTKKSLHIYYRFLNLFAIKFFVENFDFTKYNFCILPAHNIEYASELFLQKLSKAKINTLILPSYLVSNKDAFYTYINNKAYIPSFFQIIKLKWMNSSWLKTVNGKTLMRMPYDIILMYEKLGISGIDPWIIDYAKNVSIITESVFTKKYYIKQGVLENQIIVLGSSELDNLAYYKNNRFNIVQKLGLDVKKKIIALAPPMPHVTALANSEFTSLEEAREFIFSSIAQNLEENWQCIVTPHPRDNIENIKSLCQKYGFLLFVDGTDKAIGISDIFIATISGTIRWAIAGNIPILNYDFYNLKFEDYENTPVKTVSSKNDFTLVIKKLLHCNEYRFSLSQDLKSFSNAEVMLEGSFEQRFLHLCKQYER